MTKRTFSDAMLEPEPDELEDEMDAIAVAGEEDDDYEEDDEAYDSDDVDEEITTDDEEDDDSDDPDWEEKDAEELEAENAALKLDVAALKGMLKEALAEVKKLKERHGY